MYVHFLYRKYKLAGNRNNTLSMSSIICLITMDNLTDEVNTSVHYMVSRNKIMISGLSSIYGVVYLWLINYYYYCVTSCNQVRTMCSDFCIFHSPLSLSLFHIDSCKNCKLNKILQSKEGPLQNTLHGLLNRIQREYI